MENELVQNATQYDVPNNDEYSIFNYLKEHTSVLIALTSALVAVFSFILNMTIYLNVNAYLSFWEIDASQITVTTSNQLYCVLAAFIFEVVTVWATFFISNTYDAYSSKYQIEFLYMCQEQRDIKKTVKKLHKKISAEKKRIFILRYLYTSEEIDEIKKQIVDIEKEQKINKESIYNLKKKFKKVKRRCNLLLAISNVICFLVMLCGYIFLFMTSVFNDNIFYAAAILAIVHVSAYALVYGALNYFVSLHGLKKRKNDSMSQCVKADNSQNKELPIIKVLFGEYKFLISNKTVKSVLIQLIVITLILLWSLSYSGYSKAREQKEFYYIVNEEELYAVIYNNGEDLILKKAYIDTDIITIDLSVQKTISAKDVVLYIKKFSAVEVIPIE